jgi:hypothetical protein
MTILASSARRLALAPAGEVKVPTAIGRLERVHHAIKTGLIAVALASAFAIGCSQILKDSTALVPVMSGTGTTSFLGADSVYVLAQGEDTALQVSANGDAGEGTALQTAANGDAGEGTALQTAANGDAGEGTALQTAANGDAGEGTALQTADNGDAGEGTAYRA